MIYMLISKLKFWCQIQQGDNMEISNEHRNKLNISCWPSFSLEKASSISGTFFKQDTIQFRDDNCEKDAHNNYCFLYVPFSLIKCAY